MSVNLIQLRCPNCDAFLEVEDGLETYFCSYCGTKILLDGQSDAALSAKTKLKLADKAILMREKRYEQRRFELEHDVKSKRNFLLLTVVVAVGLFLFMMIGLEIAISKERDSIRNENDRLEALLNEIKDDIANGEYDEASLKIPGLRYTLTPGSNEYAVQWDEKREAMIEIIQRDRDSSS